MLRIERQSSSSTLPTGREVLVVEDELRIRTMLSRALAEMGYNPTLVASAEAGAKALAQQRFDIMILDLNLPGAGGIEFLEAARKQNHDLQVIILTGFGDLESARKAIHLDVVEFLTKPCALGSLEIALERARKKRRGQIVNEVATRSFEEPEPRRPAPPPTPDPDARSMEDIEQQHILSTLEKNAGNRAATAKELGISLRKLYYRLGEYQRKGVL